MPHAQLHHAPCDIRATPVSCSASQLTGEGHKLLYMRRCSALLLDQLRKKPDGGGGKGCKVDLGGSRLVIGVFSP